MWDGSTTKSSAVRCIWSISAGAVPNHAQIRSDRHVNDTTVHIQCGAGAPRLAQSTITVRSVCYVAYALGHRHPGSCLTLRQHGCDRTVEYLLHSSGRKYAA